MHELSRLIFEGEINNAKARKKITNDLLNNIDYDSMDWNNYFKYGGFPTTIPEKNYRICQKKLFYSIDSVIEKDLKTLQNITRNSEIMLIVY